MKNLQRENYIETYWDDYLTCLKPRCVLCILDKLNKGHQKDLIKFGKLINDLDRKLKNHDREWSYYSKYSNLVHWSDIDFGLVTSDDEDDRDFYVEHLEFVFKKRELRCYVVELVYEWKTGNYLILTGYKAEDGKLHSSFDLCPFRTKSFVRSNKALNKDVRRLRNILDL